MVGGAAISLRQGGKYPEATFKDTNKRWAEEWFVVANPAPTLPPRTGLPPVLNAKWEEKPNDEEMVEVEVLLAELQKLKDEKLTDAAVALSFAKRLTQPIQERVHPGYEYSGRDDPTRVQNCKISRGEAHRRVTLIVSGEVRDKGCPKAYCLKRPTTEEKIVSFWCPEPLPEGQQGKAVDPPTGLALPEADAGSFSSNSSVVSESDDIVEVSRPAAGASFTMKRRHPTPKVAASKALWGGVVSGEGARFLRARARWGRRARRRRPASPPPSRRRRMMRLERSPTRVAQSLPSVVPLKPNFSVQRAARRASISGAERKAEESTGQDIAAEVAKGDASPSERPVTRPRLIEGAATPAAAEVVTSELPQGVDVVPLEVMPMDGAKGGTVEDPADPDVGPRVTVPTLAGAKEPPEEKAPEEGAAVTKEALMAAIQCAVEATKLEAGDGSAIRVLQLEELRALRRHHYEASTKQSAKLKELNEVNEMMTRELKVVVAANEDLHQLHEGAEGRESLTEQKLRLEKQRCEEVESHLANTRTDLDQLMAKIDALLVAFELEGVALAEEAVQRLDHARERLTAFVSKTAKDSVQFVMALVKSHSPETDLNPMGEGIVEDCTDADWDAHFAAVGPLAERIMSQVNM
ncbi:hypothetical protein C2845_PM11G17900 [Panicum miliaceum]|uniref:Uncharacterized protein n=1 Tax=Panicum miliaceum TaxID=4540 RepID=A0A3L6RV18_PANMI|nr:hypothetical protein C2845_PM11G17900 [Panicum miliaceum]